jgi:hypothetical protein
MPLELTRKLRRLYPDQYRHTLLKQLQNYVVPLCRWKAARDIKEEAVELTRDLCRINPERHRRTIAEQLQITASTSKAYGKPRALSKRAPWSSPGNFAAFIPTVTSIDRHTLVQRLQNYVLSLYQQGQWEAVCDVEVEAVELTRELYRLRPDRYRNDLCKITLPSFSIVDDRKYRVIPTRKL